ncbi:alpha/beta hydrolase [Nocardia sp. NPDC052254]|uniref:alpha/beta hydrolase n=1 Tax=Nocardia sp. NPDC052254 TaxID=3155681 RepID=UPI00341C41E7
MRENFRGISTDGVWNSVAGRRASLIAAAACAAVAVGFAPATAATGAAGTCTEVSVPVALAEGEAPDNTVAATWCTPRNGGTGEQQADVLVAGATYGREYWDSSFEPQTYSYVDDTLAAGRATFNFDRLGTGASSRPASARVTVANDAFVLHQLIDWVHRQGYAHINAVGHSLGSVTLINEASRWHDLERVVLTGVIHLPGVGLSSIAFFGGLYPAMLDPMWAGKLGDPGYLTTMPGKRGAAFYAPDTSDPAVIDHDERTKTLTTVGEVGESAASLLSPVTVNPSRAITARVLVAMGSEDNIFCNLLISCRDAETIRASEAPYYSGAADFDALVVPGAAHNLTLHRSAPQAFQAIDHWIGTGNTIG